MNDIETLLWETDATGLAERVNGGDVAPLELVEAAIARAEATGGQREYGVRVAGTWGDEVERTLTVS